MVSETKKYDATPLMNACLNGHSSVVELLLRHPEGAEGIRVQDKDSMNALIIVCSTKHGSVVELLLKHPPERDK